MLRGYRGPLLALLLSLALLALVLLSRLTAPPAPATQPGPSNTPPPVALPATATQPPTLAPQPTLSLAQLDTSTLNEAIVSPDCVLKLNPLLAGFNRADRDVSALIFEGLMTTDERGAAVPDLAAAPPRISGDGLTYVVKLRTDVQWQDGQPFTSADVAFTVAMMQDPEFPGPADLHAFWRTVEFDALDAETVRFKLAQPLATFQEYLRIGILPEHALKGTTARTLPTHPFNLSPIGSGPYQFDGLVGDGQRLRGVRLRLAATYANRPEGRDGFALHQMVFHCYPTWDEAVAAFQRGLVNSIGEVPPAAVQQIRELSLKPYAAYRPALGAVIYNWTHDSVNFFRDLRMRQALFRSVDRAGLVKQYMADRAVQANSPILPSSWAYAPGVSCPGYDLDAARSALTQVQITPPPTPDITGSTPDPGAPTPNPAQGGPNVYRFELLVSDDPALAALAEQVKNSWNTLGLAVDLVVVDRATFRDRLSAGGFDAALVELNLAPTADPDPYSLWRQVPHDGGLNFGGMNERRLSELVEQARQSTNGSARVSLYREFQQLFCDRAAALLLYYPVYYYGADVRLSGIQLGFMGDPADRFRTIHDWRFIEG